jgi:hypothetical protein
MTDKTDVERCLTPPTETTILLGAEDLQRIPAAYGFPTDRRDYATDPAALRAENDALKRELRRANDYHEKCATEVLRLTAALEELQVWCENVHRSTGVLPYGLQVVRAALRRET